MTLEGVVSVNNLEMYPLYIYILGPAPPTAGLISYISVYYSILRKVERGERNIPFSFNLIPASNLVHPVLTVLRATMFV